MTTNPSASLVAVSTEASRRSASPAFTTRRSTTTSIVWFLRLSSTISSSSWRNSRADEALTLEFFELLLILALTAADHGREDHDALVQHPRGDLLDDGLRG